MLVHEPTQAEDSGKLKESEYDIKHDIEIKIYGRWKELKWFLHSE